MTQVKRKGWQTTNVPNLLKHRKNGRYYARYQIVGKSKFVALKTTLLASARLRLLAELHMSTNSTPRRHENTHAKNNEDTPTR